MYKDTKMKWKYGSCFLYCEIMLVINYTVHRYTSIWYNAYCIKYKEYYSSGD